MSFLRDLWIDFKSKGCWPSCCRGIEFVKYDDLCSIIESEHRFEGENLCNSLFEGKILIIKNAFSNKQIDSMKTNTIKFWNSCPSTFHKMIDGVPNFHRVIDHEVAKNYSFTAIKHSAYCFPWNDDITGMRDVIMERWSKIKVLVGLAPDAFVGNIPSSGTIDRIQICLYPPRFGVLETHTDPTQNQPVFISGYMSERKPNGDYESGGFYVLDDQNEVMDLEGVIGVGDMAIGLATIKHGVAPVDPWFEGSVDWFADRGRWFLGLYSNDSDMVKHRKTGSRVVENPINTAFRIKGT